MFIKSNTREKMNFLYDAFFCLVIFFLPFSNAITNIGIVALVLILPFILTQNNIRQWIVSPFNWFNLLLFYLIIIATLNNSLIESSKFFSKFGYLVLVPLLIFQVKRFFWLKIITMAMVNALIFLSIFKIIKFYNAFQFLPFADGWATNAVLLVERPYMGILCLIGIILSFEAALTNVNFRIFYIVSFLFSLSFMFLISIRISILTFFLLSTVYVFFYSDISRFLKYAFSIGICALFLVLITTNDNFSKRFFIDNTFESSVSNFKEQESRVIIWNCVFEIAKSPDFSILLGIKSPMEINTKLVSCYDNSISDYSRKQWFLEQRYNTHNQYLDIFLLGGIMGLIITLIFVFKTISASSSNFINLSVVISFFILMIVENIFHRQLGCLLFSIFIPLLSHSDNNLCKK